MEDQSNISFAQIYGLDERKYAGLPVKALLVSNRTSKRFRQNDIITVADLLQRTPSQMMNIQGFGEGCLKEIQDCLSTLEMRYPVQYVSNAGDQLNETEIQTSETDVEDEKDDTAENTPKSGCETIAELLGMDPAKYTGINILSLSFSARAVNLFRRNGVVTVTDLLRMTENELFSIKGFGKTCWKEIEARFSALCVEGLSEAKRATHTADVDLLLKNKRHLIANGDFSFAEGEALSQAAKNMLARYREAYDMLGGELASACIFTPAEIGPIVCSLKEFCKRMNQRDELLDLLKRIPEKRWNNKAIAYIRAYTNNEARRAILLGLFRSDDALLREIVDYDQFDSDTLYIAKRFLMWCTFDLYTEIEKMLSVIYTNDRAKDILCLRVQNKTLDQIGKKYKLTRERVRQIEAKAKRAFQARQGRVKIISKINADKNDATIVTASDIAEYCNDRLPELLFFLKHCDSPNFSYDEELDVFVVGDDSLHDRTFAFVEQLPELISGKDIPKLYKLAESEYDLTAEMVDKAISEAYQMTGSTYHRSRLKLADIYAAIIREFYPNGINAYDPGEIKQFRKYVMEKYGEVNLPANDRALTARIAGICVLCGRGRYRLKQKQYIPKELAQRIRNYIDNSEHVIFMTNTLFSVFEEELVAAGVDNKYFLQGILHEIYGDRYTFSRDYISKNASVTSIYSSVVNYIKRSDYPISKQQLLQVFPGLPEIAINLATSDPDILNYFGEYLHASKLVVSEAEKQYLKKVIERVLVDGNAHHGSDFYDIILRENPEVLTRNAVMYPFSAYSVLEYLFRGCYQFSRPYVAHLGIEIGRPTERLHEFVYGSEEVNLADISDFIRENHFYVQSILEFINACNDKYLLINGETMMAISGTGIDASIATIVEELVCAEIIGTTPVRELTCWSKLPAIKVPWTEWLLYSVLHKWATRVEVAASYNQFRLSIPLVAPKGQMDTSPFAEAYKNSEQSSETPYVVADDLDQIDDLLADMLGDELLEDDLWD